MLPVHGYLFSRLVCCTFLRPQDHLSKTSQQTNAGLSLHFIAVYELHEKLQGPKCAKAKDYHL